MSAEERIKMERFHRWTTLGDPPVDEMLLLFEWLPTFSLALAKLSRYSWSRSDNTFEWFEQSIEFLCSSPVLSGVGVRFGVMLEELPAKLNAPPLDHVVQAANTFCQPVADVAAAAAADRQPSTTSR